MKKILVAPITFLEETCFDSKFRGATNEELCAEINDFPDLNSWVDFNSSFVRAIEL